ncbi:MAG: RusA family crossover junction endodeoxyribonuclease [Chloroflexota bacterium]
MLPFEFTIGGPPVSHQTHNVERLRSWQRAVRQAAAQDWPDHTPPVKLRLKLTVVYYHDGVTARIDNDNMVKPIQDALNGLIYVDDSQITDTYIRKTDLNGRFHVRGMSPVLAQGFCQGEEFIYVRIELAPDHEELI